VEVLKIKHFTAEPGGELALAGPSGSGKTTFLHIIAGLILPTSGRVIISGQEITGLSEMERELFRARQIGYVFQNINLLESLTVLENILLAACFGRRLDRLERSKRAQNLLERVGLAHRLQHFPRQLSRGEQQRVAIARSLINGAALILADEPTASLDGAAGRLVLDLLRAVCRENMATLIIASHDPGVLRCFNRVCLLKNGNLQEGREAYALAPGMA